MLTFLTKHSITLRFHNRYTTDYQFIKQKIPLEYPEVFLY